MGFRIAFIFLAIATACGGGVSPAPASLGDAAEPLPDAGQEAVDAGLAPDVGPSRGFRLASSGVQVTPGAQPLYQLTNADLTTDPDVVAIHEEFYGIPWDEFESGTDPPADGPAGGDRAVG